MRCKTWWKKKACMLHFVQSILYDIEQADRNDNTVEKLSKA